MPCHVKYWLTRIVSCHFIPCQGVRRYWTPFIRKAVQRLSVATAEREAALRGIFQALLGRFCQHLDLYLRAVNCMSGGVAAGPR